MCQRERIHFWPLLSLVWAPRARSGQGGVCVFWHSFVQGYLSHFRFITRQNFTLPICLKCNQIYSGEKRPPPVEKNLSPAVLFFRELERKEDVWSGFSNAFLPPWKVWESEIVFIHTPTARFFVNRVSRLNKRGWLVPNRDKEFPLLPQDSIC